MALKNIIGQKTTTTGAIGVAATIDLDGAAIEGHNTFADGGAVDGTSYSVGIKDGGGARQVGRATYTSGTPDTLTIDSVLDSTNGGSAITLTSDAEVYVDALLGDFLEPSNNLSDLTDTEAAQTNLSLVPGTDVQVYDENLPTFPVGISTTEVGYLRGVTSNIQTQLNAKLESGDYISTLTNDAGFTSNIGTITEVSGIGYLTGEGTSGSVSLDISSFYKSYINNGQTAYGWGDHALAGYLSSGDNISTLTNDAGYTSNIGDVTNVSAGAGLTGGGASGSVSLALSTASQNSLALADTAIQPSDLATVATSGAYSALSGLPSLGTAASYNVPATGDATTGEVVKGNDTRLTDARTPTAHTHSISDLTDWPGSISTTELGYLDGVSSNIQTQLNAKYTAATQAGSFWNAGTSTMESLVSPAKVRAATEDALNAYSSSAPMFASRAWVNFYGVDTSIIRGSGNVSSVTDNGVGDYTINYTTALNSDIYSAVGVCSQSGTTDSTDSVVILSMNSTSTRILTKYANHTNSGSFDPSIVSLVVVQ